MATRDVTGERYFSTFIAGFIAHCSAVYCHQGAAPLTSQSSSTWWRRRWKTTTQRRRSRRHSACSTLKVKVTSPPANSGTHSDTVAHHLHTEFELILWSIDITTCVLVNLNTSAILNRAWYITCILQVCIMQSGRHVNWRWNWRTIKTSWPR